MWEDNITGDDREECGPNVENCGTGQLRRRFSSHEGATVNLAMEDDVLVENSFVLRGWG